MVAQEARSNNSPSKRSPISAANRLLWIYLAIGGAWILLSDYAVNLLLPEDHVLHAYVDGVKGIAFVVITGLIMFKLLMQRELLRREQALAELEFFESLIEFSNDAVYVLDPEDDFRLIHVNAAAVKHFGYPREKLLTLKLRDWDPDYIEKHGQEGWERLKTARFAIIESTHRLADGRVVPVEVSANYIQYKGKEYAGGYFRDISARKKTEAALRESQERYELALRGAELGTWDWNVKTGKTSFNRRWAEMLGYRVEDLAPDVSTWEKLVHPEDMPEAKKKLENHFNGYTSFYTVEHRLKTRTGEWLWVLASGSVFERDTDGKPVRAVGIHLDIDDRKRAERLAQEQRATIEGILNSVPQAVFWKDRESRYLGCNRVFADDAGLGSPQKVIGKTDFNLPWSSREASGYVADDLQVITSKQAKPIIIESITLADGSQRWIQTSKTPLFADDGHVFGVLGVYEDITERKQAQEALKRSEKLFSEVYNGSPDALFLVDWKTRLITDCNARALTLFEAVGKAEVIGQAGYTWHRVPRTEEAATASREVVEKGGQWIEEVEYVTQKGNHFWGLFAAQKLELPEGATVLVRITDVTSLKRMEQSLREQRDFSRWTMDVLPGVFYVLEEDGRIRLWNSQLERITGRKPEQIRGVNCLEVLHPEDHEQTMVAIKGVFQDGEDQVDARLISLDGKVFPYHFHGRRIELEGKPCILGVGIDIQERLTMEAELQHQLSFQRTLMDAIPLPIAVKGKDGAYLTCNRAFEEFTGFSREKLTGLTGYDVMPELTARMHQQIDEELMANPGIRILEEKLRNKAGELRDVLLQKTVYRQADGAVGGVLGVAIDVTDRKQNEARLLLQESALNAAANGIVIADRAGKIIWSNPAFTTLTGYTAEEVAGLTPQVLKSGRQSDEFYSNLWQTITSGHVWRGELVNRRKDGTLYDEEMTITPVCGADGRITNFIAIKLDISQRKQMEAQYLRAQRMEGIGLLAGGIAHDLNNVLAPVLMSIQLLEDIHPDKETREILHSLQDSAQRGADIVRQVLTFARGIKGERLLIAPKHLIKDISRVAHEAFPRNIRVCSSVPNDLWSVTGDPTQLHQVLLNLSINARDAMPDGGTLHIDARNETVSDMPTALGVSIADGDYVVLSVKDSGMGIPVELHERIFEPFFTTKEQGKGTGLGLSTVMGIIKSHHGYLKVNSAPGKGAEFLIYLPAVKEGVIPSSPESTTVVPSGHGELILLVDDEPAILEIGRDILVRRGYRVLTASDGTEALTLVAQNEGKVHLVITDIMMPFMDGVALVRSLKKMTPTIKIIASSGLASGASMISKVDELRRLGVSPIMHKPFVAQTLLINVANVLQNKPIGPESGQQPAS